MRIVLLIVIVIFGMIGCQSATSTREVAKTYTSYRHTVRTVSSMVLRSEWVNDLDNLRREDKTVEADSKWRGEVIKVVLDDGFNVVYVNEHAPDFARWKALRVDDKVDFDIMNDRTEFVLPGVYRYLKLRSE